MSLEYIRDSKKTIYVSRDIWQGLWVLSKSKDKSMDELADDMLRNALFKEHPYLIDYLNERKSLEKAIIKKIGEYHDPDPAE